jgi:hypothetical protein
MEKEKPGLSSFSIDQSLSSDEESERVHVSQLTDTMFKGRSNILFEDDIISRSEQLLSFQDRYQSRNKNNYSMREWEFIHPFTQEVRILDFSKPQEVLGELHHMSQIEYFKNVIELKSRLHNLKRHGSLPKRRGLIWKSKVKRR